MSAYFFPNEEGIRLLFSQQDSGLGVLLSRHANRIADASRAYLSIQRPGSNAASMKPRPYRREGDLQDSIRVIGPFVGYGDAAGIAEERTVQVQLTADAEHRDHRYSVTLRDRGFRLVDLESL